MYILEILLSFLVPSTSGLAVLTMPIMAPLADFSGVGRDLVVTAYQSASGVVNLVTPTSAVVMGGAGYCTRTLCTMVKMGCPIIRYYYYIYDGSTQCWGHINVVTVLFYINRPRAVFLYLIINNHSPSVLLTIQILLFH